MIVNQFIINVLLIDQIILALSITYLPNILGLKPRRSTTAFYSELLTVVAWLASKKTLTLKPSHTEKNRMRWNYLIILKSFFIPVFFSCKEWYFCHKFFRSVDNIYRSNIR